MNASGLLRSDHHVFVSTACCPEFSTQPGDSGELALMNPLTEDYAGHEDFTHSGSPVSDEAEPQLPMGEILRLYEVGKTFTPVPGQELPTRRSEAGRPGYRVTIPGSLEHAPG